MRRSLALGLLLMLFAGPEVTAQLIDDALVPSGRIRLHMSPIHTRWESRFGLTEAGVAEREELGADLTRSRPETLFPGVEELASAIEQLSTQESDVGYVPLLGATIGRITQDVTRVDLGGHIGVFDWLTIGGIIPLVRTRTNIDPGFLPDTLSGNLGLNPTKNAASGVSLFLAEVKRAELAAQQNALQACSASSLSNSCTSAQALSARAASFFDSAERAYSASPFFPIEGSSTATVLTQATTALDTDLLAAGLTGISTPMVFASEWVNSSEFANISTRPGFGIEGAPLGDIRSGWSAGAAELSATIKILESSPPESITEVSRFSYRFLGTLLGRLPTGTVDHPDFFLDVGTGDGQSDVEGRLLTEMIFNGKWGITLGGLYGIQFPRTLVRRVASPEIAMPPLSTRHLVTWNPGEYLAFELAPILRLSAELSLFREYRMFKKSTDTYELSGSSIGASVNPDLLEQETRLTVHEVGGTLRYDTLARWRQTGNNRPMQLHLRVRKAIAGSGGQAPVTTRVEFGVPAFQRFWGGP